MTKIPGEIEAPKPITKEEREARKAFRQLDAKQAMTEHGIAQKAFSANRERAQGRAADAGGHGAGRGQESQDQEEGALKLHPLRGTFDIGYHGKRILMAGRR
jgi:hypothetical protein